MQTRRYTSRRDRIERYKREKERLYRQEQRQWFPLLKSTMAWPYGKYAGLLLHEAPLSYLDWFDRSVPKRDDNRDLLAEIHRLCMGS